MNFPPTFFSIITVLEILLTLVDSFDYYYYYDESMGHQIPVEYCGGRGFLIDSPLSVAQYPLQIPGLQSLHMAVNVSDYWTAKKLAKSNVQAVVRKKSWFGRIKIPCMMGIGSCTRPLREILPSVSDYLSLGQTRVVFHFANACIPDIPVSALLLGDYDVEIKLVDPNSTELLGCAKTKLKVIQGKEDQKC